jgi:hypothetical protein
MRSTWFLGLAAFAAACTSTPAANDAAMAASDSGPTDAGSTMCSAVAPTCVDDQISMLDLFTTVNMATITEEGTAPAFLTHVDATAGGLTPSQSYVYVRFTPTGLQRVDISDQDAFASTNWDIAIRRFVIRLNSGVSGPSCVQAARTTTGTTFDGLTTVPANLAYNSENYMTPATTGTTCTLITDGSAEAGPATVLSSWFVYDQSLMCLETSQNIVYVLALASGRHVKVQVAGYYEPISHQTLCNAMQTIPMPYGSGNIRLRWAFLD